MIKIELIELLIAKIKRIDLYEKNPLTEEQYVECKSILLRKISKAKKVFRFNHDMTQVKELRILRLQLNQLVSPSEYETSKRTIEKYKKSYINELSEKRWTYEGVLLARIVELKKQFEKYE